MCDPITLIGGLVAGAAAKKFLTPAQIVNPAQAQPDPAAERAAAEASAANAANQKIAADKRARQANVLALGGNDDTLGGPGLGGQGNGSVLAGGAAPASTRGSASPVTSVLGGGAVAPTMRGGGGSGGVGRGSQRAAY